MDLLANHFNLRKNIMQNNWITDARFCNLEPLNVFHRQLETVTFDHPGELTDQHILFRKKFTIGKFIKCSLNITADDYYKLYINGRFVSQGPAPGYPMRYFYNTLDVTDFLHEGENLIAVHTYYQGVINRVWVSGDLRHGLNLELFADDKSVLISDETFRCQQHTAYTGGVLTGYSTQFLEHYKAGAPEVGFEQVDFDDSAWQFACKRKFVDYTLLQQPTKQLVFDIVKPETLTVEGNRIRADFGAINIGYLCFTAHGKAGSVVEIFCGQELKDDGSVRCYLRASCEYISSMTLSGKKSDVLNEYDYKAFRYAEIVVPEGAEVDLESVAFLRRHYPFDLKAICNTTDEKLLQIWQLCCDSLHYGIQEVSMDCMEREKGYYLGDGSYSMLTCAILTREYTLLEKFFDDFLSTSFINRGLITCGCCSVMQEIAESPMSMFVTLWCYLKLSGNKEFVRARYAQFADILDYYSESYAEADGLLNNLDKWCVVEWPKQFRDNYDVDLTEGQVCRVKHNVINAYYIGAIKAFNRIAAELGLPPYADEKTLSENFIKAFYDPEKKLFRDTVDSRHISSVGNIFAAYFGLCPDEESEDTVVDLISQKRFSGSNLSGTVPMITFLQIKGRHDLAYSLLTDESAWLNTIREGGKRTFEGWSKDGKWNTSLFHLFVSYGALFMTDWNMTELLDFRRK
ncbi:MAG: alpha-L-rhamnosidase [Lentisphaerae bacterium]|nr:alpha-L-rhamnosidase [Lentisphaerota bacterium]